jgi:hypothetical protein
MEWIDQYSGKRYGIAAGGSHGSRTVARVKSYGDVLREYKFHPEAPDRLSRFAARHPARRGLVLKASARSAERPGPLPEEPG